MIARYAHEDYLPFVREAQPELVQAGLYGTNYWSQVHTKHVGGFTSTPTKSIRGTQHTSRCQNSWFMAWWKWNGAENNMKTPLAPQAKSAIA